MNLRGTPGAVLRGEDELPGKSNYILGNDPRQWRRNIPTFSRLRYSGVYPGIDLLFYGNSGELEHDFIVQPGGDPVRINLEFKGAQKARLDPSGDLQVETESGMLILKRPVSYQTIEGKRREVSASFILDQQQVRFRIGHYDRHYALTIDPVMIFGTYFGGNGSDQITAMTLDSVGNIYLTGSTTSTNFPTKTPEQAACVVTATASCGDAFITKLDPTGSTLIYSTYLGGSSGDTGESIAVAPSGVVTIAGETQSSDFPSLNVPATGITSGWFVTSLSADGTTLVYSGILEPPISGSTAVVTVDAAGDAYVAAQSDGGGLSGTPGSLGNGLFASHTLFVVKLNPAGGVGYCAVVRGTFVPGPFQPFPGNKNNFIPAHVGVDASGAVYITGTAAADDLPVTPGVIGSNFASGAAFALKIDPTGSTLIYATYVPGTASATGMALAGAGNIILSGAAVGGLPVSPNAFQRTPSGSGGYVLELGATASNAPFATYLSGNSSSSSINGLALGSNGNLYVIGNTTDPSLPLVNPLQTFDHGGAGFVAELNNDGSQLLFSSMLNGTEPANWHAVAVDSSGKMVVAGDTDAHDFPTTSGSFQPQVPPPVIFANIHGVIAKIDPAAPAGEVCAVPFAVQFPTVLVNTSTQLPMTFYNCGNATLHITGVASSTTSFSVTANCASVAPNTTCPATITYSPTAVTGLETATILFQDDAGLPTPSNFAVAEMLGSASLSPPPSILISGTPAATVKSGSPAVFNLSVTPMFGFTGQVTLSCSTSSQFSPAVPQFATCTASPSSVTLTGSAVNFTVTVSTQTVARNVRPSSNGIFFAFIFAGPLGLMIAGKRMRKKTFLAVGSLSLLALLLSCGGGSAPVQQPPPVIHNTPAGVYVVNVTTSLGPQTSFPLTLVVQ